MIYELRYPSLRRLKVSSRIVSGIASKFDLIPDIYGLDCIGSAKNGAMSNSLTNPVRIFTKTKR